MNVECASEGVWMWREKADVFHSSSWLFWLSLLLLIFLKTLMSSLRDFFGGKFSFKDEASRQIKAKTQWPMWNGGSRSLPLDFFSTENLLATKENLCNPRREKASVTNISNTTSLAFNFIYLYSHFHLWCRQVFQEPVYFLCLSQFWRFPLYL